MASDGKDGVELTSIAVDTPAHATDVSQAQEVRAASGGGSGGSAAAAAGGAGGAAAAAAAAPAAPFSLSAWARDAWVNGVCEYVDVYGLLMLAGGLMEVIWWGADKNATGVVLTHGILVMLMGGWVMAPRLWKAYRSYIGVPETEPAAHPLFAQVKAFQQRMAVVGVLLALAFMIASLAKLEKALFAIVYLFVPVVCCVVPRDMNGVLARILTSSMERLAAQRIVLKSDDKLEVLANTAVICTDVAGALTQDQLAAWSVWTNQAVVPLQGKPFPNYKFTADKVSSSYMVAGAALFDDAQFQESIGMVQFTTGSKTAIATMRFAANATSLNALRAAFRVVYQLPFNSARKYAVVIAEHPLLPGKQFVFVKGDAEVVLNACSSFQGRGHSQSVVTPQYVQAHAQAVMEAKADGHATVGFATAVIDPVNISALQEDESLLPVSNLVHLGFLTLVDPPCKGVNAAIASLRASGVRIAVVTADDTVKALAAAKLAGLVTQPSAADVAAGSGLQVGDIDVHKDGRVQFVVLTGAELQAMTSEQLDYLLTNKKELIFTRVTPEQKLELVSRFQRNGQVVALVGDATHDAPALQQSDVAVVTSKHGSEVAMAVADLIVGEDGLRSIEVAVAEARHPIENLKKYCAYSFARVIAEIFPMAWSVIIGFPLGLNVFLVLFIETCLEYVPRLSLAVQPPERGSPSSDKQFLTRPLWMYGYVWAGLMQCACCILVYLLVFISHGVYLYDLCYSDYFQPGAAKYKTYRGEELDADAQELVVREANTAWFVTLVFCQMWHLRFVRTRTASAIASMFSDMLMNIGALIQIFFCVIIAYVPGVHEVAGTTNIDWWAWFPNLLFLVFVGYLSEGYKFTVQRNTAGSWVRQWLAW